MKKKVVLAMLLASVLSTTASTTYADARDDEIRDLRFRVNNLERANRSGYDRSYNRFSDRFSFNGEFRFSYWNDKEAVDDNFGQLELRLLPTIRIDDNLSIKARITGTYADALDNADEDDVSMDYAYIEGIYDKFQINVGKLPLSTHADRSPSGSMIADEEICDLTGAQFITGDETKIYATAGRRAARSNYFAAEVTHEFTDQLTAGAGYHFFDTANDVSIGAIGAEYTLNDDWKLYGAIAHNFDANNHKTAYNFEATYLEADPNIKSSWGAYAAYRNITNNIAAGTSGYETFRRTFNKKGFEIGASWIPIRDTMLKISYFDGKFINVIDDDDRVLYLRGSVFF